ncbi:MAG: TatD family hydrolase [Candidatus Nanohaloarchaea archaeon]
MKPVDAHCHLDFEDFDSDRQQLLEKIEGEMEFVVNAGRDVESNRASLELEENDAVVANLGLHPTNTDSFDELEEVKEQAREHPTAAIGEIGLDHHHVTDEDTRERQEEFFREMLELAEELGKPVVVHSREAEEHAVDILEDFQEEVMLHCFNGSPELAERAVESGMYIGVTTQVLYSSRVHDIVEEVPLEHMLLETDSPFLYQGERNEPVNVKESAERIADIKDVDAGKVVEKTTRNAKELFR